ncbi:MAG: DNA recombination protein RmuC [Muribaculaceae bacterium]
MTAIYILSSIILLLAVLCVVLIRVGASLRNENRELNARLISDVAELSALRERLTAITTEQERLKREAELQFGNLATKILDEKTQKSDVRLGEILRPLKQDIERLNRELTERAIKEGEQHASLKEQIAMLANLNRQISTDANNLVKALKGNSKMQGDWGEMILEQILESSGLIRGEQFEVQVTKDENGNTLTNDSGNRLRPDVVVKFPDSKKLVIDSKVSITNYVEYVNSDDRDVQDRALAAHLASVKKHVDELSSKRYQSFVKDAGDFVLMFVPNEGAYLTAMQADHNLWDYAYNKHVVIISPTHLISVLKLVSQLWRHDSQTKNAIAIAEASGKLYDKFVGFMADMSAIEKALSNAGDAYSKAMNKLSTGNGNLVRSVEKLKEMGAKATKQLPEPK